jgi:hypothetical protein
VLGNLLKWKRAAERYLMKRCFFTIVHSGALIDEKGGKRQVMCMCIYMYVYTYSYTFVYEKRYEYMCMYILQLFVVFSDR